MDVPFDLAVLANINAVVNHYNQVASSSRNALQARSNGVYGHLFGPNQTELDALNTVIGNNQQEIAARRDKVLNGTQSFDDFRAAVKADEIDVAETAGYAIESSLDDVILKTAEQSGQDVKHAVNEVAETGAKFALAAIPGWVYVLALGLVAWKVAALRKA